jgi:hypothetical protein
MVDNPVTNLEDARLLREGEAACREHQKHGALARWAILPMAKGLLAARRIYASHRAFNKWLSKSPYRDLNPADRAALIKLGGYPSELADFLGRTDLVSPRNILNAMEDEKNLLLHDVKTDLPHSIPIQRRTKYFHPDQADLFAHAKYDAPSVKRLGSNIITTNSGARLFFDDNILVRVLIPNWQLADEHLNHAISKGEPLEKIYQCGLNGDGSQNRWSKLIAEILAEIRLNGR